MAGEKVDFEQAKADAQTSAGQRTSEQSTIAFPNHDLDTAVTIAGHVYERSGLGKCPLDELAAQAGTTMSGNFRNKNSAARLFGFIEKDGQSAVKLTDLGARVVSAGSEADAKAAAFLNVPLYIKIFENYRGKLLPPTKALEREMVTLGVIPTQATAARQIMQRSARQAGFYPSAAEDRLVRPRTSSAESLETGPAEPVPVQQEYGDQRRRNGAGGGGRHPFIEGLLERLPDPDTVWAIEGRAAWLEAAASVFKLIYQGDGKITITAQTEPEKRH